MVNSSTALPVGHSNFTPSELSLPSFGNYIPGAELFPTNYVGTKQVKHTIAETTLAQAGNETYYHLTAV